MFVQVTAKNVGGVFYETQCSYIISICIHIYISSSASDSLPADELWRRYTNRRLIDWLTEHDSDTAQSRQSVSGSRVTWVTGQYPTTLDQWSDEL